MFAPLTSPAFATARWVFARLLGAIFFCAFASLAGQVRGLMGEHGIVPAREYLDAAWNQLGESALWQVPSIFWIDASDTTLLAVCFAGMAVSVVLMAGILPGFCSLLLWALYLSLCSVGSPFLNFQWDALLLETALLAVFFLPFRWRPDWRTFTPTACAARWLLCWLLFRLMFQSGVVKLASGDETWRGLSALDFHFETQPLPLWTAWYVHQLPGGVLSVATAVMFAIELLAPWLIAAPRRWRHGGASALIALQLGILATGNYTFFNYLSIALCMLLFDDDAWPARLRITSLPASPTIPEWRWRVAVAAIAVGGVFTALPLLSSLGLVRRWPAPLAAIHNAVAPLRSFNGYGLFAVMTTSRLEISIEGSDDGKAWREYEFNWKPGNVNERPRLVAPFQPRLDWQMWFAALGTYRDNPWFMRFLGRLLEGAPEVTGLLRTNPFPDKPPRTVRAVGYDYHFTHLGDRSAAWWRREPLGLYCPPVSLNPNANAESP